MNTPGLVQCLYGKISKCSGCKLIKSVSVTCIDHSSPDHILVTTSDKVVHQGQKLILTPGTYINNTLSTLKPAFSKVIDFDINFICGHLPTLKLLGVAYFFGNKKNDDEPIDENLYYGLSIQPQHMLECTPHLFQEILSTLISTLGMSMTNLMIAVYYSLLAHSWPISCQILIPHRLRPLVL